MSKWIAASLRPFTQGVRVMNIRASLLIVMFVLVNGCAYLPSVKNKLYVRPTKFVPCLENMGPGTSCGAITVEPQEAEGFEVVVGWKRFAEITNPDDIDGLSKELKISRFADFAISEVISLGYCKMAIVPNDRRKLFGWEGSGDRGIYIVCRS